VSDAAPIRAALASYRAHFVGRSDLYAVQQADGSYRPVRRRLTDALLVDHLAGDVSLASYFGQGHWTYQVCLDSDRAGGLLELNRLAYWLLLNGLHPILEDSRRGGHLWLCLDAPVPAALARHALLGVCHAARLDTSAGAGLDLFPKSEHLAPAQIGNPVRLPLGIHRKTGQRYPLVRRGTWAPVALTFGDALAYVARVPLTTPAQIAALAEAYPVPPPPAPAPRVLAPTTTGERPGDVFNATVDWRAILEPHGWREVFACGQVRHWCRPGKTHGTSATTGYGDHDGLYVFTSNAPPLEPQTSYSKFAAYALLAWGGDHAAAARALRAEGFGGVRGKVAA